MRGTALASMLAMGGYPFMTLTGKTRARPRGVNPMTPEMNREMREHSERCRNGQRAKLRARKNKRNGK